MKHKTLEKLIDKMVPGECVWVNAISLSVRSIERLRKYIKDGVIAPDEPEMCKSIVHGYEEKYRSGEIICPQMLYIKN